MKLTVPKTWQEQLEDELRQAYFLDLMEFVTKEYENHVCYPKKEDIFAAFEHCPFDAIKVVIIGQDPYHGENQANGLCFSVKDGVKHPPSLVNIFKELESDIGKTYPASGNLEHWANQGVLLLNATLSVRAHEAGSHQKKGWEKFTDYVIQKVSDEHKGIIFMLWGGFAKKKVKLIDTSKHHVLTSGHPSPLSANRGHWFKNRHFSCVNRLFYQQGEKKICW